MNDVLASPSMRSLTGSLGPLKAQIAKAEPGSKEHSDLLAKKDNINAQIVKYKKNKEESKSSHTASDQD